MVVDTAGCGCNSHLDVNTRRTRRGAVRGETRAPIKRSPVRTTAGDCIRSYASNNSFAKEQSAFVCVSALVRGMLPQRLFDAGANQKEREMLLARQIMGWLV